MGNKLFEKFLLLFLFAVAMGYLESSVVVYLRTIYYPGGFDFPLKNIDRETLVVEVGRETATIIMLLSVALVAGDTWKEKFAWFLYCFAVWDIFYYVFLYLLLNWPASMFTWDILFLIPFTWTAPVLAPVINSLSMILLAFVLIHKELKKLKYKINWIFWTIIIGGCGLILISYMENYLRYMLARYSFADLFNNQLFEERACYAETFIPTNFNWWMYLFGQFMILFSIWYLWKGFVIKSKH
ncbi:MAG: hypothetical protein K8R53_11975 [Bacteroidales bacterium]|nr:hypothetical protein [Bacteroidales bacterium]